MKPLYVVPLASPRSVAVYFREEGFVVIEREWRGGKRYLDLSTQQGPYDTRVEAIAAADARAMREGA